MKGTYRPSVALIENRCVGCTTCIKRCPTEAIRVRSGRARILSDLCIDCGMCIRVCRHGAKVAVTKPLDAILATSYKVKVALPAPSLYSQFAGNRNLNRLLTALKKIGFDEAFEVAKGAEIVTAESIRFIQRKKQEGEEGPWISTACPAIVRLIQVRFPSLIDNLIPIIPPMEAIARMAREYFYRQGYKDEEIGIFFITPCAAKVTDVHKPQMVDKSAVTSAVALNEVYFRLLPVLKAVREEEIEVLQMATNQGVSWARIGGESEGLLLQDVMAVDGIENVIEVLDSLEDGRIKRVEFIEANACIGGCLGGPLAPENPFNAKARMQKVMRSNTRPQLRHILDGIDINCYVQKQVEPAKVLHLDEDMAKALEKMKQRDALYQSLPQIDCGSCGAPGCEAFAQDVVQGEANVEDCIFLLRDKVKEMAQEMVNLAAKLPPSIKEKE